ncbi:Fork head domain transcription factor slp1 [Gryllus bimaculatus]|nr:Fork head domain transcription factor slp1 [Gryllus bimaculatus]
MRGPRTHGVQNNGNPSCIGKRSNMRTKRKILSGVLHPSEAKKIKDSKRKCTKKRNEDEQIGSISNFEVIVVDGRWDTSQAIPSLVGELRNINDVVNMDESGTCNNSVKRYAEKRNSKINRCAEPYKPILENSKEKMETSNMPFDDSGIQCNDNDDSSNLTWLINFKLDTIIQGDCLDDDEGIYEKENEEDKLIFEGAQAIARAKSRDNARMFLSDSHENVEKSQSQMSSNRSSNHQTSGGHKKPPFTYTELIEQALREKGELTVSGIYCWISEHFPFYKADDDRWKNSVRHNLSINPHFRKGSKASQGAGHLWRVANLELTPLSTRKQQRIHEFISDVITLEEVEAATASIEENKENRSLPDELFLESLDDAVENSSFSPTEIFSSDQTISLEQSAEEILSGVKKDVEVQYLIPIQEKPSQKNDFLNPITKDVTVQECGLMERDGDVESTFLITDLNPIALELNMIEPEVITSDTLFSDDMDFECYEFTPQQLQV